MNLASLIKTVATGTPGYNFKIPQAQLPSSFAGIVGMARNRGQDINNVYRSMDRTVDMIQKSQNTTYGSSGGGFAGLATAVSGYGTVGQYSPDYTMASLAGGAQTLHNGAFADPAYLVGQMMFIQAHGGLHGLMKKGIYKKYLQNYAKIHHAQLRFGLDSPYGAAMFMQSALKGHAVLYNYAVAANDMLGGFPGAIKTQMLNKETGLGRGLGGIIRQIISKNPNVALSNPTLIKALGGGHGIAPGSDLATAMTAPIGQEMIQFTASMTSLVKSGVITKFGSQIGSLNMAVHDLTQKMGRLSHLLNTLKGS